MAALEEAWPAPAWPYFVNTPDTQCTKDLPPSRPSRRPWIADDLHARIDDLNRAGEAFLKHAAWHLDDVRALANEGARCDAGKIAEGRELADRLEQSSREVADSLAGLRESLKTHSDLADRAGTALLRGHKQFLEGAAADNPSATCPLCFERAVDTCYTACGHTACAMCVLRMRQTPGNERCPVCRVLSGTVRLFFTG